MSLSITYLFIFTILLFRLDLHIFTLAQPETTDHQCWTDQFIISGGMYYLYFLNFFCQLFVYTILFYFLEGSMVPTICGTNHGAHLYVDFPSDLITMFIITNGNIKTFKMHKLS